MKALAVVVTEWFPCLGFMVAVHHVMAAPRMGPLPFSVPAASASSSLPQLEEPLLAELECETAESEVLVATGPHGAISHSKLSGIQGRPYSLKEALAESAVLQGAAAAQLLSRADALQQSLDALEPGALVDRETPGDGHCLFHALMEGGLFAADDTLRGLKLTIHELRRIALNTAEPQEIEIAAQGSGEEGLTVPEYIEAMIHSGWGDNLMIAMLAKSFQKDITIISVDGVARTYFAAGGEVCGTHPTSIWVAHHSEWHYYGVVRAGSRPNNVISQPLEDGQCECGWFLVGTDVCLNRLCFRNREVAEPSPEEAKQEQSCVRRKLVGKCPRPPQFPEIVSGELEKRRV